MPRVHLVVSDLEVTSAARQVSLIAPAFLRPEWSADVYSMAGDGPFAVPIQKAGVQILSSDARNPRRWFTLRGLVCSWDRDVVHAFGLSALRRLWIVTVGRRRPRIVLSLNGRERLNRFDRRCLRIVSTVLVPHATAADALTRQGIPSNVITVVPFAVGPAPLAADRTDLCRTYGLPSTAKLIVTAGRMDARGYLFDAVWGFEFLRYVDKDVHLVVIGDGPGRYRLETNARALAPDGSRVHFVGARLDVPAVLGAADLVVLPHRTGGANVALEAMAAGRPIVAANTPDLAALIRDGEYGVLVPAGKPSEMARAMRRLLAEAVLRARLGNAGRQYVLERHSMDRVVPILEAVYGG